jgi:subtilisin family serine protease
VAEREYAVVVKKGVNLEEVDADLSASTGDGPIPNRTVDIANPRPGSKRMTHWMLTDEEAEELRKDDRILAVEIPPDQRDDIQIGNRLAQSGNFYRGFNNATDVNWGLRRCNEATNVYGGNATVAGDYNYALDGNGVDIVIQDSGIQVGHPEWNDYDGNTRLVQINWYTESGLSGSQDANHYRDLDGHGTHVTGIAAGLTYGWAKGARIYSQKLSGLELLDGSDGTGIPIADAFDAIRLWHLAKLSNRPTVVNMSWGYFATSNSNPTGGTYRGTPWSFGSQTDTQLWDDYGIVFPLNGPQRFFPVQNAVTDAEVDDMIAAGIHVCIAAGNDYYKQDVSGGNDYDNFATFDGTDRYYHRPGSPYSTEAFYVGNIDSTVISAESYTNADRSAYSSRKGPAVDIWAPGTDIMSATSNQADASYTTYGYPPDGNYEIMSIDGTSMASPQVAGLIALHLQSVPEATPAEIKAKLAFDSKSTLYETTNNDTDYRTTSSLLGSPNRHLFSRYGVVNPYTLSGSLTTNLGIALQKSAVNIASSLWVDDNEDAVVISNIVSSIAIQVTAALISPPDTPFTITGRSSGASTTVTNISANTGSLLELDVANSAGFIVGEGLDIT